MSRDDRAKPASGIPPRRSGRFPRARPGSVDDLRRLLVGPEQRRIEHLEERVVSPETVADVLPEAVALSDQARGDALGISLEPAVSTAVRNVARNQTHLFADVLSPVIGSAVRRAVGQAIRAMLEKFNAAIERSMSVQSLRWRLEAKRTGRPFGEVILLRTLVYRVEQVFLIHNDSGLLLEHVTAEGVEEGEDPDQVASMLTAIDAFAQEALRAEAACAHIAQLQFGDLTCWIERGASATVAAVVRGVAPNEYCDVLREAVERIHLTYEDALAAFRSDVSPFESARPSLEACLQMQRRPVARHGFAWVVGIGLAVLAFVIGLAIAHRHRSVETFAEHLEALRAEPGIVVTSAHRRGSRYTFEGLRDPLAREPADILARRGITDAELRFEPYYSADPRITEARIRQKLDPPPGVSLRLSDGTLRASGTAPRAFIERAGAATLLAGVDRLDDAELHEAEALAAARADAQELGRVEVRFRSGSSRLGGAEQKRVDHAAAISGRLVSNARAAHMRACIVVRGYADPTGTQSENRALSEARARAVVSGLVARGVDPEHVAPEGRGVRGRIARTSDLVGARTATFGVQLRSRGDVAHCGPT